MELERVAGTRFTMLRHRRRRHASLALVRGLRDKTRARMPTDGLRVRRGRPAPWTLLSVNRRPLFDHLLIDVGQPPAAWFPGARAQRPNSTSTKPPSGVPAKIHPI